ncbi:MAG: hypothetical protein NHB15_08295 [Methanosarcina barkeri]|nr:hypothetical protein [Methanosarcina sp. ERenArc_MAG2]
MNTTWSSEESPAPLVISGRAMVRGFCSRDADAIDETRIKNIIVTVEAKAIE